MNYTCIPKSYKKNSKLNPESEVKEITKISHSQKEIENKHTKKRINKYNHLKSYRKRK